MEEQVFRKGVHKFPSMLEYKSPTTLETPEIHTILVETDDPEGPFGAKEAGQGPLLPIIPAVANAVWSAVGVRVDEIADHAGQGAQGPRAPASGQDARAWARSGCRASPSRSRVRWSRPSACPPKGDRGCRPSSRHDAPAAVPLSGPRVGGGRRPAHGRARAGGHAGGGRHRPVPEHEAAPVRALRAGGSARHPGPGRGGRGARGRSAYRRGHHPHRGGSRHPDVVRGRIPRWRPPPASSRRRSSATWARSGGNVCVDTRCNYYNQSHQWRKAVNFCMKKDGEICLVAPSSSRCWAVSSSDTAPVLWSLGAPSGWWARRASASFPSPPSIGTTASSTSPSGPMRCSPTSCCRAAEGLRCDVPQAPPARRLRLSGAGRRGGASHGRRPRERGAHRAGRGGVAAARGHRGRGHARGPAPRRPRSSRRPRSARAGRRSPSTTRTSRIPTGRR